MTLHIVTQILKKCIRLRAFQKMTDKLMENFVQAHNL